MKAEHIQLGLLPVSVRDHRPTLVVDVEHQLVGLLGAVAEQLLEHERDIGHEVDRVVPDENDPRSLKVDLLVAAQVGLVDLDGRRPRAHGDRGGLETCTTRGYEPGQAGTTVVS